MYAVVGTLIIVAGFGPLACVGLLCTYRPSTFLYRPATDSIVAMFRPVVFVCHAFNLIFVAGIGFVISIIFLMKQ
ncbi:hypothetical protein KFK09_015194 [Dendrobium nobile]|uniref:Uncharacterized protein n=1 Tax=Dendrobium nobile TaxID=94219 RepID=A0A8T3B436_DENNO|nr:hypothetical protein KFK09_015194 [Dendrobium nobile]